ncbi:hypothetical protein [Methylovulum psychrotolerans]|uniref:Stability/partitioning determinant n=1 Tax=Methylovulum psychrotolerans TaxID=1704499 RepID=A0A2S5CFK8_9GAMM|nr:hypothetical protein [Methylovulum psychrotolerans]MBT9100537.1 hypothetical protein [Methylovulum psychrotolerans]POZ49590.1 hypothetical protein AADEFJLK_04642 [Methylovulum psychrotolerans]
MVKKKTADLSASLVAVKGTATAASDAIGRHPETPSSVPSTSPLNFKVDSNFRRRFRQRAAEADLKLIELLREALDSWEEKRGIK